MKLLALTFCAIAAWGQIGGSTSIKPGGAYPRWSKYSVAAIANGVNGCASNHVGPDVFTGSGLNDATAGGTYTATSAPATYTVIIDATGIPNTFKWQKNAGAFTTGVAITGAAQALADGVTIAFAATTGHTLNDQWVIAAGLGCWQINGVLGADKAAALTQSVTLSALPARGYLNNYRIKSSTACTGTTTLLTGLGTASSSDFYLVSAASGYDLKGAVSDTNIRQAAPLVPGSNTVASVNLVASLTSTVENIDQIAAGCAFDVWVLWTALP